jgi:hypothetical protein
MTEMCCVVKKIVSVWLEKVVVKKVVSAWLDCFLSKS